MKKEDSKYVKQVKKVKKIANGCWWVELYLLDSCGLIRGCKND